MSNSDLINPDNIHSENHFANSFFLYPIKTIIHHQYKYGLSISRTIKCLFQEGGLFRFYNGLIHKMNYKLIVSSVATIAYGEVPQFLSKFPLTKNWPQELIDHSWLIVYLAFSFFVIPLDNISIFSQVNGNKNFYMFVNKMQHFGYRKLYAGQLSYQFGLLSSVLIQAFFEDRILVPSQDAEKKEKSNESVLLGVVFSQLLTNQFLVLGTMKMTSHLPISYYECLRRADFYSLTTRGLALRILYKVCYVKEKQLSYRF